MIQAVLGNLTTEDLELLLARRGLPTLSHEPLHEALVDRLEDALNDEFCRFEWEAGQVPEFHCEMETAGGTMLTWNNSILVWGGMDSKRKEHDSLWKWDLSSETGFQPVEFRGWAPQKHQAGHYAAVWGDELWVFPGPRNICTQMHHVHCLNLRDARWSQRTMRGEPPNCGHWRRNLSAIEDADCGRLLVFGGPQMEAVHEFNFERREWKTLLCADGLPTWTFSHAVRHHDWLYACGSRHGEGGELEMWAMHLAKGVAPRWGRCNTVGTPPPHRIHSSAALVGAVWVVYGGRCPGKLTTTNAAHSYDFGAARWDVLMASGATPQPREWQCATGLLDCVVVVGGRTDTPPETPSLQSAPADTMSRAVEILWVRERAEPRRAAGKAALLEGMAALGESGRFSDVVLVADGGAARLPAHRAVLAMRSPVFDRMWRQDCMLETRTAEVHIEDVDAGTLRAVLAHCYGGLAQLPRTHAGVLAIFRAADKYDISDLVAECIDALEEITGCNDVAPLLQAASECASEALRAAALRTAARCLPNVVVSPAFGQLLAAQPGLATGFLREAALKAKCTCEPDEDFLPASVLVPPADRGLALRLDSPAGSPVAPASLVDAAAQQDAWVELLALSRRLTGEDEEVEVEEGKEDEEGDEYDEEGEEEDDGDEEWDVEWNGNL
ncbi:hypothetical protein WJX81_002080 [Elliptochloris bilobata]|uniref:BTB domain-containing protein n=1 Tax=Elliptochloris bilobata TaxID=381761 RepID=A0AAW1S9D6_9CHLO